jgi:hydrogenase small subunit
MACFVYHPTLSATQGEQAIETIRKLIRQGQYILICEGAIPLGMPQACLLAGQPMLELLSDALRNASLVIAAGSCAAFAGIPGAEGNATGAVCVRDFMEKRAIPVDKRLINCPGCPCHPDSLVATLAHVAAKDYPKVDPRLLTPDMIYGHSVHDDCPRFHYWQKNAFAQRFGEEGCLFKLGCLGPLSHTNCPQRQWNGGVNWCIRAGAPCIACTSPEFARRRDFAFYRLGEKYHAVTYHEHERRGDKS